MKNQNKHINGQLKRALISKEERKRRRQLLRSQTGIPSRKPKVNYIVTE